MLRFILITILATLGLVACSGGAGANSTTGVNSELGSTLHHWDKEAWMKKNMQPAPYLNQWATKNAQAYMPKKIQGVPLPKDAPTDAVIWQRPACIIAPFTGSGPTKTAAQDGVLELNGYAHTEFGAVAAGIGLFSAAASSKDVATAIEKATGISPREAQRIAATNKALVNNRSDYDDSSTPECSGHVERPTQYRVIDYSDTQAIIDYFIPMSGENIGASMRISVDWKNGDWRLNSDSFSAYDSAIDAAKKTNGKGWSITPSDFTQW